jgi:rhamnose utilization protein RhaD (predicted bifunctional aldolase and dehydrogenase)
MKIDENLSCAKFSSQHSDARGVFMTKHLVTMSDLAREEFEAVKNAIKAVQQKLKRSTDGSRKAR